MAQVKTLVDTKIAGKKVVVFSKTTCGFCSRAKSILREYKLSPEEIEIIEINEGEYSKNMSSIQDYLLEVTKGRTVSNRWYDLAFICLQYAVV